MRKIDTILFDLSDALVPASFSHIAMELASTLGVDADCILPAFGISDESESPLANRVLLGKMSEEDYFSTVITKAGWNLQTQDLKKLFRTRLSQKHADVISIAKDLSENSNHRMILVSDICREWADFILQAHPTLMNHFCTRLFSHETGLLKRNQGDFAQLILRAGLTPESCLLIDDSRQAVAAAQSSGITAILFENPAQLRTDLVKANLL